MSNSITIKKKEEIGANIRKDAAETVKLVGAKCEINNFRESIINSMQDKQNVFEWIADKVTGKQDKTQIQQKEKEDLQNEDEMEI